MGLRLVASLLTWLQMALIILVYYYSPYSVSHACAARQGAVCSRFGIGHYPTLKVGRPADFEAGKEKALEEYSGVKGEKEIIEWVGKQMST